MLSDENPTYLPFGMAAIGIVLYTVLHPSVRKQRSYDLIGKVSAKRRARRDAPGANGPVVAVGASGQQLASGVGHSGPAHPAERAPDRDPSDAGLRQLRDGRPAREQDDVDRTLELPKDGADLGEVS